MVLFEKQVLANGLKVIVHEDPHTPLVSVNVLYQVGSRDEQPTRTGFAHLFEHLMFAGSKNAPDFDEPLQHAGGENNAFTTSDYTNFYEVLPAENVETALWLESDRMAALKINKRSLSVQQKVVVEEFKETCFAEPYGDMWHHLSAMAYTNHPYRWPVIGLVPEHIEQANLEDVRQFYEAWYRPNNAILVISGRIEPKRGFELAEKWFGSLPAEPIPVRDLPMDAPLDGPKVKILEANVPVPAIFLAFRTPGRLDPEFNACDLITDVLANGDASRLYQILVKEQKLFSQIDANLTASVDPGLLIIEGRLSEGVTHEAGLKGIWAILKSIQETEIPERELQKLRNRYQSGVVFSELNALNKAQNLALYEFLGDANLLNTEVNQYLSISAEQIQKTACKILNENNSCTLLYVPAEAKIESPAKV